MILLQRVSKVYPLYRRPSDRILELLPFARRPRHTDFWALRDISLSVERGETLAVIGPNGSGKSTLLQVIAGILRPTRGRVVTEGRVSALLELGAGFNPEFTGRENVVLSSEIMGLTRDEIEAALPRIERFAEVGDFFHRPIKEYSSGMHLRLAFACAIHVKPDILIVDEALAVGDAIFANRCIQKFEELKERKITVVFVSHDLGLVKRLATRAVLMLEGRVEAEGSPTEVVNRYIGMVLEKQRVEETAQAREPQGLPCSFRHGDGTSRVNSVTIVNEEGRPAPALRSGELMTVRVAAEFFRDAREPMVGILIRNRLGVDVFGTNTRVEGMRLGDYRAGEGLEVAFTFRCLLARQEYTLTVATQHWDGSSQDWLDDVLSFSVTGERDTAGVASLPAEVSWKRAAS